MQTKNPVQALVESEQATTPATFCFARVSNAGSQVTSGAQVYRSFRWKAWSIKTSALFPCYFLFPNVDADWYLLHLPREPPNHHAVHVTSLSCCIVSRKSDTILPHQEIQLQDGKSYQTPQSEPASGDGTYGTSCLCNAWRCFTRNSCSWQGLANWKKLGFFTIGKFILPFVPNIYRALGKPSLWREGAPEVLQQNAAKSISPPSTNTLWSESAVLTLWLIKKDLQPLWVKYGGQEKDIHSMVLIHQNHSTRCQLRSILLIQGRLYLFDSQASIQQEFLPAVQGQKKLSFRAMQKWRSQCGGLELTAPAIEFITGDTTL